MPRGRPRTKTVGLGGRSLVRVIDRKPIRPLERQRMRPWLLELLDDGVKHQLAWYNKRDKTFRISWKHAAGQTFDFTSDATLFELWARHTGKFYPGDAPDPKKWKANFRCALHSLQDVVEDKKLGVKKGNNAFRVYRFLDHKKSKKSVVKSRCKQEDRTSDEDEDKFTMPRQKKGTQSRPLAFTNHTLDSEGSEPASSPLHDSSGSAEDDWEMARCQMETDTEHSPLPHFDQIYGFSFDLPKPKIPEIKATISDIPFVYEDEHEDELVIYMDPHFSNNDSVDLQEEVVYTGTGPSVIVLEEQGDYDYQSYTSLVDVPVEYL